MGCFSALFQQRAEARRAVKSRQIVVRDGPNECPYKCPYKFERQTDMVHRTVEPEPEPPCPRHRSELEDDLKDREARYHTAEKCRQDQVRWSVENREVHFTLSRRDPLPPWATIRDGIRVAITNKRGAHAVRIGFHERRMHPQ